MARQRLWWLGALIFIGLVFLISSNSAQWVFLARVQWVALLALAILPVFAHTLGRERISHQVEQLLYTDVADYIIEAIEQKWMSDEDLERGEEGQA